MSSSTHSQEKHPLSSGMDHALDGEMQGAVKQLRRPGDNGPAMQSAANTSPQVKQLKASEAAANTAVIQRKKSNETGLPDDLKAGIESLSGISMDHVKVVYNSSKPAEVNALAYAQGSFIHVAPGQEAHLPEEAWHVVQQIRGEVKATTQVNQENVNDDPALEREARDMGAKAALGPQSEAEAPATATPAPEAVLQRRIEPYKTTALEETKAYYKNSVVKIANMVDGMVESARDSAINWSFYADSDNKRLRLWADTADKFYQDPDSEPDFIHARFGYAIEELVSAELPSEAEGLTIDLQVAAGHTRPDIVLRHGSTQVAWMDITAEESVGHIKNKDGAGWSNRPFVCEVLYDSLDLEEVLSGSGNPLTSALGTYSAQKSQIKHKVEEKEKQKLTKQLTDFADSQSYESGCGSSAKKKDDTKKYMNTLGMKLTPSLVNIEAKGTLAYLDVNPLRFGFKDGGSTTAKAKQFIEGKARNEVQAQIAQLQMNRLKELVISVSKKEKSDLQQAFVKAASDKIKNNAVEDIHVKVGIAVWEVLELAEEADQLLFEAELFAEEDKEAQSLIAKIYGEIHHFMPNSLDLKALIDWHSNLLTLKYQLEEIMADEEETMGLGDSMELVVKDDSFL